VLWEAREQNRGAEEQGNGGEISPLPPCSPVPLHYWSGYSDNYIRVVAASDADLTNQFTTARVIDVTDDCVVAEL
jgi:hypothetical protein